MKLELYLVSAGSGFVQTKPAAGQYVNLTTTLIPPQVKLLMLVTTFKHGTEDSSIRVCYGNTYIKTMHKNPTSHQHKDGTKTNKPLQILTHIKWQCISTIPILTRGRLQLDLLSPRSSFVGTKTAPIIRCS